MAIQELVKEVKDFFESVLGREAHVIGVTRCDMGWSVQVETIEESEYMRARALDDVVGIYEVEVNEKFEIVSYKRTALRERDKIEVEQEDE